MGSTKLFFQALVFLFFVSEVSADNILNDMKTEYRSTDEIKQWAVGTFFGGYRLQEFIIDSEDVIVVIGHPTSGIDTSEVVVFVRADDPSFKYVMHHARVRGTAEARVNGGSLECYLTVYREFDRMLFVIMPDGLYNEPTRQP